METVTSIYVRSTCSDRERLILQRFIGASEAVVASGGHDVNHIKAADHYFQLWKRHTSKPWAKAIHNRERPWRNGVGVAHRILTSKGLKLV